MLNLFRRPSGIYVLRIAVPVQLRSVFNKREIVASTGTRELTIAKIVASAQVAQWRQRFFDSSRLMSLANTSTMDHQEILKLAHGHPVLLAGGHLTLSHACAASGISTVDLLRASASGNFPLFVRAPCIRGYLLPLDILELNNPAMGRAGGFVVPSENQMPVTATEHIGEGMLRILAADLPRVTATLLTSAEEVELLLFELPDRPDVVFAPNDPVHARQDNLEVEAWEVEMLRRSVSVLIQPDRIREAKALQKATMQGSADKAGKKAHETLSTALDAYVKNRIRRDVGLESEIARIRNGCALLIELEGDVPLSAITADRLRIFRDQKLARVPANENKIRLMHGTTSVTESMKKIEDTNWPIMSASERNKRMRWITAQ